MLGRFGVLWLVVQSERSKPASRNFTRDILLIGSAPYNLTMKKSYVSIRVTVELNVNKVFAWHNWYPEKSEGPWNWNILVEKLSSEPFW